MAEPSEKVLSTEQLVTLIRLLKGADSAELKLSVPEDAQRSAIAALGMDALDAQIRQVVFFDTPDLTLQKAGVVVRARRVQGKPGDAIVKLRPVDPAKVPASLRKLPEFGIEVDAMPGGFVCSGRLKAAVDGLDVKAVVDGQRPIRKLFTKEQRALYAQHAPEGVGLDDLAVLGPAVRAQAQGGTPRASTVGWSRRCGSIPTGRASWSSPPSACPRRPSTSPRRRARVPRQPRGRSAGRAGDQDPAGAGVLRRRAGSRRGHGMSARDGDAGEGVTLVVALESNDQTEQTESTE